MSPEAKKIATLYTARTQNPTLSFSLEEKTLIQNTIEQLDKGLIRIAEKQMGNWQINQWVKQTILLYFMMQSNCLMNNQAFDKIPLKFQDWGADQFEEAGVRVVPPATVRKGAFIAKNTILMPSFINIGAYVDTGTMIDTWATVGSCAQIGKNVHLSGGVGIGGVLEPLQASPTIIEDNCFIGARSEVVEGVIIEEGAVLAMGVFISQSTPIYNRQTKKINYGKVPAGSVVIPGSLPAKDGSHSLAAAIIVKQVDEKTKQKIGINNLLREAVVE